MQKSGIFEACIFDLDGVLVDTAKYHFLAWKRLAASLGFYLAPGDEERLKGVSRMESLEIVLSIGGVECTEEQKLALAAGKNAWYRESIESMDESELLPGAKAFVEACSRAGLENRACQLEQERGRYFTPDGHTGIVRCRHRRELVGQGETRSGSVPRGCARPRLRSRPLRGLRGRGGRHCRGSGGGNGRGRTRLARCPRGRRPRSAVSRGHRSAFRLLEPCWGQGRWNPRKRSTG